MRFAVLGLKLAEYTGKDVVKPFGVLFWSTNEDFIVERRAAKRSPITIRTGSHACIEIETHATLLMVNMDRVRLRPTMTSRNMAALLDLIPSFAY